jgi:Cytochrome P450
MLMSDYLLTLFPQDIQDRARKEVLEVLGDKESGISPTLDQLKELTYLTRVMKEVCVIFGFNGGVFICRSIETKPIP